MSCSNCSKLCKRLHISTAVNISDGNLVINIPETSLLDCEPWCLVIAQTIPQTLTIGANVFVTITGGTQQYQIVDKCCRPVTGCSLRSRRRYKLVTETTATGAVLKLLATPCCSPSYRLPSVNGTAPVAAPATPAVASDVSVASVETTGGKKS